MEKKTRLKRALTVANLQAKKFSLIPFEEGGPWHNAFSQPQDTGIIFIWGNSGNGKTQLIIDLCKELCRHYKVVFNSLEEGAEHTLQEKSVNTGLSVVQNNLLLVEESMEELAERLDKSRSPQVAIIDSVQYTDLNKTKYKDFKRRFKGKKLLIFISHADGNEPAGSLAKFIRYDAMLKIWVKGFRATSMGRYYGPTKQYTIWNEGSSEIWGDKE